MLKEKEIIEEIKKINFPFEIREQKEIRPENREKLDFFLLGFFKNKNFIFEIISLEKMFNFLSFEYIENLCNNNPNSVPARKIGFLYEEITWKNLNFVWNKATYTNLIDGNIFYSFLSGEKNKKFKIINNILWKINWFNPYIGKNSSFQKYIDFDYNSEIEKIISSKTEYLIEKSVGYLFLKETKSSYQIEWEEFDRAKNSKFLTALKKLEIFEKFDKQDIVKIHNSVMINKKKEDNFREFNNYISSWNELMWEVVIDYVCPKKDDVDFLIQELLDFYEKNKNSLNPVLLASLVSSFFVFIHPFSDWNGRSSRYLFHYILKDLWIWKYKNDENIIVPISAYILNNRDDYYYNLNLLSKTFWQDINYEINDNWSIEISENTVKNYFYWDYTKLLLYFSEVFYNSFLIDFKKEINFLEKYYNFIEKINNIFDFTQKEKWYIWKFLMNNKGKISKWKKIFLEKQGLILDEKEIKKLEKIYLEIFN